MSLLQRLAQIAICGCLLAFIGSACSRNPSGTDNTGINQSGLPQGDGQGFGGGDPVLTALSLAQSQLASSLAAIQADPSSPLLCVAWSGEGADANVLAALASLSSEQISFCQKFILSSLAGIGSYAIANPNSIFSLTDTPIEVTGTNGDPLSVIAKTLFGPTGVVFIYRPDAEGLSASQLVALIGHEFSHKVLFNGSYVTDNDPIGPFSSEGGGRTFLNAVGAALASFSRPASLAFSDGNSFSFGTVSTGTILAHSFVLSNNGQVPATLLTPSVTGSSFLISSSTCGTSLAAGSTCVINLQFSPKTAASDSGALEFDYSGDGSASANAKTVIQLSGTGQTTAPAPEPIASVSPTPAPTAAAMGNVTNLQVSFSTFDLVNLSWTGVAGASSYIVVTAEGTGASLTCLPQGNIGNSTSMALYGLSSATTYTFLVCAVSASGETSSGTYFTATTLSNGFFFVGSSYYDSTSSGHYCTVDTWSQWLAMGGPSYGAPTYAAVPGFMELDGQCPLPTGFFFSGSGYYDSTTSGHYCTIGTWSEWLSLGGPSYGAPTYSQIPSTMVLDGECSQ